VADDVRHGKLVATSMFGFWVTMLGRGGAPGHRDRPIASECPIPDRDLLLL
jgi:hypothetical protein